jgi:nucleoside-diphosphate-sugar epimerase
VRRTRARLDQAHDKLGYVPKIDLEQGLIEEWNWIRATEA